MVVFSFLCMEEGRCMHPSILLIIIIIVHQQQLKIIVLYFDIENKNPHSHKMYNIMQFYDINLTSTQPTNSRYYDSRTKFYFSLHLFPTFEKHKYAILLAYNITQNIHNDDSGRSITTSCLTSP